MLTRRCVMRSQCDRCCLRFMPVLMDRAARSPFHCGVGHVGFRARASASRCVRRLEVAERRSAGALAATRQQSYGCAYSDVRWWSASTTFNIITIITTYISHGVSKCLCVCGFVCLFGSLVTVSLSSNSTPHSCLWFGRSTLSESI